MSEEVTAPFVYVRLHGAQQLYVSRYSDEELDEWAARVRRWRHPAQGGRDVYVYFDNDAKVHAPRDALRLMERLGMSAPQAHTDGLAQHIPAAAPPGM